MNAENPIFASVMDITKYEIIEELISNLRKAKTLLGEGFEKDMVMINQNIMSFSKETGQSFFSSGWILSMMNDEDSLCEENKLTQLLIRACIAWTYLLWYNRKYNLQEDEIE